MAWHGMAWHGTGRARRSLGRSVGAGAGAAQAVGVGIRIPTYDRTYVTRRVGVRSVVRRQLDYILYVLPVDLFRNSYARELCIIVGDSLLDLVYRYYRICMV